MRQAAYEWVEAHLWPHGPAVPPLRRPGPQYQAGGQEHPDRRLQVQGLPQALHREGRHHLRGQPYPDAACGCRRLRCCAPARRASARNQLHRMMGITLKSAWFMSHRISEAMRAGGLEPPMGGAGGIVEIDETIYGRAATHPKGRRRRRSQGSPTRRTRTSSSRWSSAAARCAAITSRAAPSVEVIPIVNANVAKRSAGDDRQRRSSTSTGCGASPATTASTTARRNTRVTRTAAPSSTPTRSRATFSLFKRGMRGIYQHCKEKHLHRYLGGVRFSLQQPRGARRRRSDQRAAKALDRRQGQAPDLSNSSWGQIRSRRSRGSAAVLSGRRSLSCSPDADLGRGP